MVFVTIGTQKYKFNRIIDYINSSNLKDVIIQCGYTKCECNSKIIESIPFIKKEEIDKYILESDFVISHGGITILEILKLGKKILVVPREKRYKEHINDHQFELCEKLEKEGYLLVAKTKEEFLKQIKKIKKFKPKKYLSNEKEFYDNLNDIIDTYIRSENEKNIRNKKIN